MRYNVHKPHITGTCISHTQKSSSDLKNLTTSAEVGLASFLRHIAILPRVELYRSDIFYVDAV